MKTTIDMAREVYGAHTEWSGAPLDRLEQLVALVRADEREQSQKWFEAVTAQHKQEILAERKACAEVVEALDGCAQYFPHVPDIIRNRKNT